MGIYKVEIAGRTKPLLMAADSAAKAMERIVTATKLTAKETNEAFVAGETLWKPGDAMPADDVEESDDDSAKTDDGK